MRYFTIKELCYSSTAEKNNIKNEPTELQKKWLEMFINQTLDVIREAWGSPIIVNSGFRCDKLNTLVNGSKTSHHRCYDGYVAGDIVPKNGRKKELLELIKRLGNERKIKYVQLINEKPINGVPSWIHIATNVADLSKNKMQYLTIK